MRARTATDEFWRCLRCGSYVAGDPHSAGPASDAPIVRRGKEIRGDLILRLFAIERFFRFLLFAAVAYGIWRFAHSRLTITQAFNRELPIVRSIAHQLGFNVDKAGVIGLIRRILHISQSKLTLIAAGVSGLAVVSLIESVGLWLARRWGEYFAMVATSLFLPVEVYELYDKFTYTKLALFLLNIVLVLYLVINRRLFGVRGGKHAYEARLRSESVLDDAAKAAAAADAAALTAASESGPLASGSGPPASYPSQPASYPSQPASYADPPASYSGPPVSYSGPPARYSGPPGTTDATVIRPSPGAGTSSEPAAPAAPGPGTPATSG